MDIKKIHKLRNIYQEDLMERVLPFWLKYGVDKEYNGIITCLDYDGSCYCTDKSGWFQGRGMWAFAKAYNAIEKRAEFLQASQSAYHFLNKHCFDCDGRIFFEITRDGRPIRKRRYWFAEAFAASGLAEYSLASGDKNAFIQARKLFDQIVTYYRNPGLLPAKYITQNYQIKSHNMRMVLVATAQVLRQVQPDPVYDDIISEVIDDLFRDFVKPEKQALLECVTADGDYLDSPLGRRINPGHSMETAWFLLAEGEHRQDHDLVEKTVQIIRWSMKRGWDEKFGGIFNYVDLEGKPSDKIEWDMKYWWTHAEAMIANLYAYYLTGDSGFEDAFDKLHDYAYSHFPDKEYGEWFGYLHRDGTKALTAKGTLFKGPFHIPRMLYTCLQLLDKLEAEQTRS